MQTHHKALTHTRANRWHSWFMCQTDEWFVASKTQFYLCFHLFNGIFVKTMRHLHLKLPQTARWWADNSRQNAQNAIWYCYTHCHLVCGSSYNNKTNTHTLTIPFVWLIVTVHLYPKYFEHIVSNYIWNDSEWSLKNFGQNIDTAFTIRFSWLKPMICPCFRWFFFCLFSFRLHSTSHAN